jgi:lipopolysaccharide transport system ATP-binding protein
MSTAVRIHNLSKQYRLGSRGGGPYRTLRESIMETAARPFRWLRSDSRQADGTRTASTLWALRDVSFDVPAGGVVGVIGRNGAGKSTLLKILSRITEPTSGDVHLRGRVGSLLEVGTGFHSELTGRENIYLNGAILGMSRTEIARKFDQIVAFAEVEAFLDTPVKRYSSGMYVRLAFAVASHLEPEILIIDEVLAVGDQAFQRKCLGRMGEVSKSGRTVLFVSHGMATVLHLCQQVAVLEGGQLRYFGACAQGVEEYNRMCAARSSGDVDLRLCQHQGSQPLKRIQRLRLLDAEGRATDQTCCAATLTFEVTLDPCGGSEDLHVAIMIEDCIGARLCTVSSFHEPRGLPAWRGPRVLRCRIDDLPFAPGRYSVTVIAGPLHQPRADAVDHAAWFDVTDGDFYGNGRPAEPERGRCLVRSSWEVAPLS